jgi:predicted XRE-type DNA-binding protein
MNTTKITLSLPQKTIDMFKDLVGKRKVSSAVKEMMEEEIKNAKQDKALKMAKKIGQEIRKTKLQMGTKEIIKAYKDERKY